MSVLGVVDLSATQCRPLARVLPPPRQPQPSVSEPSLSSTSASSSVTPQLALKTSLKTSTSSSSSPVTPQLSLGSDHKPVFNHCPPQAVLKPVPLPSMVEQQMLILPSSAGDHQRSLESDVITSESTQSSLQTVEVWPDQTPSAGQIIVPTVISVNVVSQVSAAQTAGCQQTLPSLPSDLSLKPTFPGAILSVGSRTDEISMADDLCSEGQQHDNLSVQVRSGSSLVGDDLSTKKRGSVQAELEAVEKKRGLEGSVQAEVETKTEPLFIPVTVPVRMSPQLNMKNRETLSRGVLCVEPALKLAVTAGEPTANSTNPTDGNIAGELDIQLDSVTKCVAVCLWSWLFSSLVLHRKVISELQDVTLFYLQPKHTRPFWKIREFCFDWNVRELLGDFYCSAGIFLRSNAVCICN